MSFVNGTFVPDQSTGLLATFGLVTNSFGGQGGDGGPNDTNGVGEKFAGDGGAGGSGGSVTLVANGDIRALAVGAACAVGRRGWRRWRRFNRKRLVRTTQGGAGGNGGTGGTASLQWLSGTVQTTGFGLRATAGGGVGGNGGNAGDPYVGPLIPRGRWGCGRQWRDGQCASQRRHDHGHSDFWAAVTGILVDANGGDGGAGGSGPQGN